VHDADARVMVLCDQRVRFIGGSSEERETQKSWPGRKCLGEKKEGRKARHQHALGAKKVLVKNQRRDKGEKLLGGGSAPYCDRTTRARVRGGSGKKRDQLVRHSLTRRSEVKGYAR